MSKYGTYSNDTTIHWFELARVSFQELETASSRGIVLIYQQLCASTLGYILLVCRRMEHIILQIKCHLRFGEGGVRA